MVSGTKCRGPAITSSGCWRRWRTTAPSSCWSAIILPTCSCCWKAIGRFWARSRRMAAARSWPGRSRWAPGCRLRCSPTDTRSSPMGAARGSCTCCAKCSAMRRVPRKIPPATIRSSLRLLRSLVERYQGKEITNADFEQALEEVLPRSLWFENRKSLDWFFDGWVNGTAFPQLELAGVKFSREWRDSYRERNHPPEFSAARPGHQRSGVWSGRGSQDLSRPGLCRRRRDALQFAGCPPR